MRTGTLCCSGTTLHAVLLDVNQLLMVLVIAGLQSAEDLYVRLSLRADLVIDCLDFMDI